MNIGICKNSECTNAQNCKRFIDQVVMNLILNQYAQKKIIINGYGK